MRTSILILTLVLLAGLPLQAGPKNHRQQASYYGQHYRQQACSAWVPCGHPCAKYSKYNKYRKCMEKQRKQWRKHCRKHPWDCRVSYRQRRPY